MEKVEAAEAKMNAAKDVLLKYVEGRELIDRDRYRHLAAQVKKAEAEFMRTISELGE